VVECANSGAVTGKNVMATRVILIVTGIVAILVGLNYLFAAETAVLSFDVGDATLAARIFVRATGAAVLAIGVINVLSVGDPGSRALRAVMIGNVVVHAASLYGDYVAETFSRNAVLYVTSIVHVAFIVAFGYLLATWRKAAA
jgi:hypothetical protein